MTLLPRLLYLFYALPVLVPNAFFRELKTAILRYIWRGASARVSYRTLSQSKEDGGWGLPDVLSYYRAAQLRVLVDWSTRETHKIWVHMDRAIAGHALWDLVWLKREHRSSNVYLSTPTATTLRTWDTVNASCQLTTYPSPYTPIHLNPDFTPGLDHVSFGVWYRSDCLMIRDMFSNGEVLNFPECKQRFGVPERERFHHLQIRHWVLQRDNQEAATRDLLPFERWIREAVGSRGITSQLYTLLNSPPSNAPPRYKATWEALAHCTLTQKQIDRVWRDLHSSTLSLSGREAHYKILVDWYRYPVKLHRIYPTVSPNCWRGCVDLGDARHVWWSCPLVRPFWHEVIAALTAMLGYPIPADPSLLLVGIRHPTLEAQSRQDRDRKSVVWERV